MNGSAPISLKAALGPAICEVSHAPPLMVARGDVDGVVGTVRDAVRRIGSEL